MIEDITKNKKSTRSEYQFSVLIPSWNNIDYLKLCIDGILKNSYFNIQIIVIVNEGSDGTLEWLENQKEIDYIYSKSNIGICYGLNIARSLVKSKYIVYVNDDMYLLPGWDIEIAKEIEKIGHKGFMLSCTMIEPASTGNPCVIVKNYGCDVQNFDEELLLKEYSGLIINDWNGSTWPPSIVHADLWDLVGGLSIEFSPGMYSDPDFSRKLYEAGVRYFKGKGNSLVYHFGSKSTQRIKRNKGRKTFLLKWGITSKTFTKEYLKTGENFSGNISTPGLSTTTLLVNKLKRLINSW
jgi:glycosyltransferase involved in cell wall biosynthesis